MTREVEARLKISAVDKTGRVFKGVSDKMGEINRRAAAYNRQQGMLMRSTAEMYATIARYAAPAALAYGVKASLTDFAALERQMTRIGITADASAKQTKEAFAEAQRVAKDLNYDSVQPAIEALDTLVASGKSLEEAMAFLPSVLATAQASGAATADIANTGLKAADALKIETAQLQRAFDIMVTGGKAGQFELKDMAQYIPGLSNSFASLGYRGEDGLKRLVAILQTIREDTGDASAAATQAENIFGKMFSGETIKRFAEFGIDLRKEMAAAAEAGEDAVSAFVRLSKEAIDGDYTKLPLLFSDKELRQGMQSLMTSADSLERFLKVMNSAEVNGTISRDVKRVMSDTQASIDRMSSSWERLKTAFGGAIAPVATEGMDALSSNLDYHASVNAGLEKSGVHGFWDRTTFGLTSSADEKMRMAIAGGYSDRSAIGEYYRRQYESGAFKPSTGRQSQKILLPEFPGGGTGAIPLPSQRPSSVVAPARSRPVVKATASAVAVPANMGEPTFRIPSKQELKEALKIDLGFKHEGEQAGQAVAQGGKDAGKAIEDGAAFFKVAGYDVGAAIERAAEKLATAAGAINRLGGVAQPHGKAVNADTGRSMPPSTFGPR